VIGVRFRAGKLHQKRLGNTVSWFDIHSSAGNDYIEECKDGTSSISSDKMVVLGRQPGGMVLYIWREQEQCTCVVYVGIKDPTEFAPLWIDFPLLEFDEEVAVTTPCTPYFTQTRDVR
jgi:hypothetical protein